MTDYEKWRSAHEEATMLIAKDDEQLDCIFRRMLALDVPDGTTVLWHEKLGKLVTENHGKSFRRKHVVSPKRKYDGYQFNDVMPYDVVLVPWQIKN